MTLEKAILAELDIGQNPPSMVYRHMVAARLARKIERSWQAMYCKEDEFFKDEDALLRAAFRVFMETT